MRSGEGKQVKVFDLVSSTISRLVPQALYQLNRMVAKLLELNVFHCNTKKFVRIKGSKEAFGLWMPDGRAFGKEIAKLLGRQVWRLPGRPKSFFIQRIALEIQRGNAASVLGTDFPALKNDRLLRAARGEEVDKVPVWVMRQAGRYLPEFQAVRAQHDFFTVCRTAELACEVTLQPLRRYPHLDASIIFSDILVIPQALGMTVEMHPGVGPVFPKPMKDPSEIDELQVEGAVSRLEYVGKAITLTRHKIEGLVPLIGFTGAPFTLMGYMLEGGGSKTMSITKDWLENRSKDVHRLLRLLTNVIIDYLAMQTEAGAQLLQVFESSADHLTPQMFLEFSAPYLKDIRSGVRKALDARNIQQVPMTIFAKGAGHSLKLQSTLGYEVIGLDWTVDPKKAREEVGDNITLQGNLDPQDLYKTSEEITALTVEMVKNFGKQRYIANLGHGITPATPLESMTAFTEAAHVL